VQYRRANYFSNPLNVPKSDLKSSLKSLRYLSVKSDQKSLKTGLKILKFDVKSLGSFKSDVIIPGPETLQITEILKIWLEIYET